MEPTVMEPIVWTIMQPIIWIATGVMGLFIYFLPTIIASLKNAKNTLWIFLINLIFAGTGVGWIILMIWAIVSKKEK